MVFGDKGSDQEIFGSVYLFVKMLKCMSCIATIGLCRAVCYLSVRTKEFLNKALASTGNQIREQAGIESSARSVQCMLANTESFSKCPWR